jgi:DNA-binding MarR family transcriptional regulator
MLRGRNREMAELLVKFAEFGQVVSTALAEAAQGEGLTNTSTVVLCRLELHGHQRPSDIMDTTGLTSGGVTKLIDRLQEAGWVERLDDPVPGDGRGVMVALTDSGRERLRSMVKVLSDQLGDTEVLVEEIDRLLPN